MKRKEQVNSDIENEKESGKESAADFMNENSQPLPDAESEIKDPVAKLEGDLTTANDKYLRLYSEFENYKRRISKDRIEQSKMAGADIFLSLLPILDDLERAMKSIEDASDSSSVKEGINLIYNKIKNVTTSKGLKEMSAEGTVFDPELHDAIANVPVDDASHKGKVIQEIEKGYYLNDKVIRHAKVLVGS